MSDFVFKKSVKENKQNPYNTAGVFIKTEIVGSDVFLSLAIKMAIEPKCNFSQDQNDLLIHLISIQRIAWMEENKGTRKTTQNKNFKSFSLRKHAFGLYNVKISIA